MWQGITGNILINFKKLDGAMLYTSVVPVYHPTFICFAPG